MKNLQCVTLLSTDKISNDVMIPLNKLNANAESDWKAPISIPHTGVTLSSDMIKDWFGAWLTVRGKLMNYDTFISYRWTDYDSPFVNALYDRLTYHNINPRVNRKINVFLDKNRLEDGKPFQSSFAEALLHSLVVFPVVSYDALTKMKSHDESQVDNVLVEWIISLICFNINQKSNNLVSPSDTLPRVMSIFPILFGKVSGDVVSSVKISNLFVEGIISTLPTIKPSATLSLALELIAKNGILVPSDIMSWVNSLTVRSIVETITGYKGILSWEMGDVNSVVINGSAERLVDVLQKAVVNENISMSSSSSSPNNNNQKQKGSLLANNASLSPPPPPSSSIPLSSSVPQRTFSSVGEWLTLNELQKYESVFAECGVDSMKDFLIMKSEASGDLNKLKEVLNDFEINTVNG